MIRHISALAALVALSLSAVACAAPTDQDDATEAEETSQDIVSRSAFFETFQGLDGHYYFNLTAANGQNVLRSQGYTAAASARGGIASVLANGSVASSYEVFETASGSYAFRLVAANGEVIARGEAYSSKSNATRAVSRLAEILSGNVLTTQL